MPEGQPDQKNSVMRQSMYDAPYNPAQDAGNPVSPPPSRAKIAAMVIGILSSTLVGVQGANLFPPDSSAAKAIVVALALLSSLGTASLFILGETKKEVAKLESAAKIGAVKAEGRAGVALVAAQGAAGLTGESSASAPLPDGPVQAQAEAVVSEIGDRLQEG